MSKEDVHEQVVTGIAVTSEKYTKKVFVGDNANGCEIIALVIVKNSDTLITVSGYDEDENHIYTLNVFKPVAIEVFMKQIVVDGPAE